MVNDHSDELEHLKQIHMTEIEQLQIQFDKREKDFEDEINERKMVHQQDM